MKQTLLFNRGSRGVTRRSFLRSTGLVVGTVALTGLRDWAAAKFEPNSDTLKIGLIGCGGRGTGAVRNALDADPNCMLWAMGDVFMEKAQISLRSLRRSQKYAPRIRVSSDRIFIGLDAFQKVIDSGVDVVILATPPGFRPQHFEAAVKAGKHIFCEKPMATDVVGGKRMMEAVKLSKTKPISVVAGFCWRRDYPRRAFYEKIHEGALGKVRAVYATYLTGPVRPMPPNAKKPAGMSDLEWQLRHWYNFVWLSGDGLVEQACHSVDKILWAMQDKPPVAAVATGGRQIPNPGGNIYDHIDVFYEWEDGTRAFMAQRQIRNCYNENSDYVLGTKGIGYSGWITPYIVGEENWRYKGPTKNMYVVEHEELFKSIRTGNYINDGDWMVQSTMVALMGRMAAYTGKKVTWDFILHKSQEKRVPDHLEWDMKLPVRPMAMPGITPLE